MRYIHLCINQGGTLAFGIGKHLFGALVDELVEDDRLIEHLIPRKGMKPAVLLGRSKLEISKTVTLDAYEQDSKGVYHQPPVKEAAKKEL